jgi:hypothetical protein
MRGAGFHGIVGGEGLADLMILLLVYANFVSQRK